MPPRCQPGSEVGILRISAVWGQEEVHGNLVRVGPRSCQEFRMHRNEMIGEVGFEQANSFDQSFVATRGQGACNGDDGGDATVQPDDDHHGLPQRPLHCCGEATMDGHWGQGSCWICRIQGQSLAYWSTPIAGLTL